MSDAPVTPINVGGNEPHREKYVVAVFSTNRFDSARIAGVTHSVADAAAGGRSDIVKSIEFEPRVFARDTLAKAMQIPRNAGALPRLVRVPSAEADADGHHATDMREWRHGFTPGALELQSSDHAALDADGILILLPNAMTDRAVGVDPAHSGEAVAARYSLWLMLLLIELQHLRDARRADPTRDAAIPVAFGITDVDRTGRTVLNPFERETELFRMVFDDAGVLALSDDRRDVQRIVKYFGDRLSSPSSAIVWSSPTDAILAHTPAVAFRRVRRRRIVTRATAAIAALGAIGLGYQWIGSRLGAPGVTSSIQTTAHVALAAAFDPSTGIPDQVRRTRLNEALELCKRPAAKCEMSDVLRIGYELRRLRNRAE